MIRINDTLQSAIAGTINTLNAVAAKLGTSVEHMWPAFVSYTQVQAFGCLVGLCVLYLGLTAIGRAILKIKFDYDGDAKTAQVMVPAIGWFIALLSSGLVLPKILAVVFVPEAGAMMKIIDMLK